MQMLEIFWICCFSQKIKNSRKDYDRDDNKRWAFRIKENRSFANIKTSIDWAKSSDSMVLLDLPSSLTNIANQRDHYLTQSVSMGMLVNNFSISIMREGFQSLNPFITYGYIKKPELNLEYKNMNLQFHILLEQIMQTSI